MVFPMIWTVVLLAAMGQAAADERAEPAKRASLERMVHDLSAFEVSVVEPPEALTLHPSPLLRWSYPIRNVDDAALFVWLGKERPEAIVTVMSYRDSGQRLRRAYEFLSLSEYRLSADRNGQRWWRPEQPGFAWRNVPSAPRPAGTAAQRRRQMRELAATFEVAVQSEKNRYQLRLLSQPLHRYQNEAANILDGALFAFVEGTDPELILALETSVDEPAWKFATGRLTRWEIEVRCRDKVMEGFAEMTGAGAASDVYLIPDAGPLETETNQK